MEKLPCSIGNIYIFKDFKGSILDCYVGLPECTFSIGKASVFQLPFFRGELLNFRVVSVSACWIGSSMLGKKVPSKILPNIPSLKLTWLRPWKWMVGMSVSFWEFAYFQVRAVSFREGSLLGVWKLNPSENYASQKNWIISPGKCSCPVGNGEFHPMGSQSVNKSPTWQFLRSKRDLFGMVKSRSRDPNWKAKASWPPTKVTNFSSPGKRQQIQGFYEINRGQNIYPDF